MKLAKWLEKPTKARKKPRTLNVSFNQAVARAFQYNEAEFQQGANREARIVPPEMIELLP